MVDNQYYDSKDLGTKKHERPRFASKEFDEQAGVDDPDQRLNLDDSGIEPEKNLSQYFEQQAVAYAEMQKKRQEELHRK